MRYRKFKADYLFTEDRLLGDQNVLITDENGEIKNIVSEQEAGENIEIFKGIISPGFVNAHCHLELSHLKNIIPEKTGLIDFVFKIVSERHFEENQILDSIEKGENEMLKNGIVAVGDISNNILSDKQKKKQNLHYYNFIETSGWFPGISKLHFEKSKVIYDEFIKNNLRASIVPHAPYSVSENLLNEIIPFFKGKTVTIHNQESPDEDLFFLEGKGDFIRMYKMMDIDILFYKARKIRSVNSYFEKLSTA